MVGQDATLACQRHLRRIGRSTMLTWTRWIPELNMQAVDDRNFIGTQVSIPELYSQEGTAPSRKRDTFSPQNNIGHGGQEMNDSIPLDHFPLFPLVSPFMCHLSTHHSTETGVKPVPNQCCQRHRRLGVYALRDQVRNIWWVRNVVHVLFHAKGPRLVLPRHRFQWKKSHQLPFYQIR